MVLTAHLELEDVWVASPEGGWILRGIRLDFPERALTVLIGPSGAGKSTLLSLLDRLRDPDRGRVLLDGRDVRQLPVRELRRRVGLVLQRPCLFAGTVAENVRFGPSARGEAGPAVEELLAQVALPPEAAGRRVDGLSGGEQQRVALARALANRPEVLLLDEPTASLDPGATLHVEETVRRLVDGTGLTVVWVSHDLAQARRVADHVALLVAGELVERGEARAFFAEPVTETGRRFLTGAPPGRAETEETPA
ncbi:MAG: phosphate ABC transporter ATP-binding protein [Bacillota bacterium]|nr:phosphate ABC transporter ATP-binding protein [Bacillota bacterium]